MGPGRPHGRRSSGKDRAPGLCQAARPRGNVRVENWALTLARWPRCHEGLGLLGRGRFSLPSSTGGQQGSKVSSKALGALVSACAWLQESRAGGSSSPVPWHHGGTEPLPAPRPATAHGSTGRDTHGWGAALLFQLEQCCGNCWDCFPLPPSPHVNTCRFLTKHLRAL